jgi:hypothetical protein
VRAKGVLRNLRRGNYAKVVAALQVRERTLAEYFPKAEIIGADINPVILLQARKHRSDRIGFVYASDRILSGLGGFDAIFCMAVLCSAGHYPFEIF